MESKDLKIIPLVLLTCVAHCDLIVIPKVNTGQFDPYSKDDKELIEIETLRKTLSSFFASDYELPPNSTFSCSILSIAFLETY